MNLFDVTNKKEELAKLQQQTLEVGFWEDNKKSNIVITKIKELENTVAIYSKIEKEAENISDIIELLNMEMDAELLIELDDLIKKLNTQISKAQIQILLSGLHDMENAIITIHPGAGGVESQDWAEMLYRMYSRWANKNNYKISELDYQIGETAGLKSVTFEVIGKNAYGYLKSELGVHRLVRISPFDAGGRRHTSFASVEVLPVIKEDNSIQIQTDDLRIDTYRASGAGGQHINKTDSAIRITHIPTNIVVSCQSERSQLQNKENAMKMLKSKLALLKEKENKEKINELKGTQMEIGWGSQIRSYVFCPYTLVKDHRTNYEVGNVQSVMDGEIDGFIDSFLKMKGI